MPVSIDYEALRHSLETLYAEAEASLAEAQSPLPHAVELALQKLFSSRTQAYREVLLGAAIVKLHYPNTNIRYPYVELHEMAFSGRAVDERVVNPFLRSHEIPCSKGPYLAVFRRKVAFLPETARGLKDKEGFEALLTCIEYLSNAPESAVRSFLHSLLVWFVRLREAHHVPVLDLPNIPPLRWREFFQRLIGIRSGGLVPVLMVVALFEAIRRRLDVPLEITWQGINQPDAPSGSQGDIKVSLAGQTLLVVEVTERALDADRLRQTFQSKMRLYEARDYLFILTTAPPVKDDLQTLINAYALSGYEVVLQPLIEWAEGILSLLGSTGRQAYLQVLRELISQRDVPASVKVGWNKVVESLII